MNLHLLHGNHSFARKKAKKELIDKYASEGVEIASFTIPPDAGSRSAIIDRVCQKLTEDSLFVRTEVVSVCLLPADTSGRSITGRSRPNGKGLVKSGIKTDFLVPLLEKILANISLILEIPVVLPVKSELLKKVKKMKGDVQLFKLPSEKDRSVLTTEAKKFLAKEGASIDHYSIQKLVEDGKGDWWYVFTALEQAVLLHRGAGSNIARDVPMLWDFQEEQNIFRLFDAIGNGDKAGALRILYENNSKGNLRFGKSSFAPSVGAPGKDMEQALGFISLMARQIRQMIAVKSGLAPTEAQKEWQIPIFAYRKIKDQTAKFSLNFLSQSFEKLVELQGKAKRGLYSPLSLIDFYVLYLISHRESGVGA